MQIRPVNRMSVIVPEMSFVRRSALVADPEEDATVESTEISYGYAQTSADLDCALERLEGVMEELLRPAEIEKSCQLMADEIESTRRRVNAPEYRTIPDLEETIKYIRMKLEENDRATITRLMKVKDMISERG